MTKRPTGTMEWASVGINIAKGCEHDCRYCYARASALRFKRIALSEEWKDMTINKSALQKNYGKRKGTIMFPTSHDITPKIIEPTIAVLRKLLESGNQVLIVSKPHLSCIKQICKAFGKYRKQIIFRFTIGTLDAPTAAFWEPNAPPIKERLEALYYAYVNGYTTSVSSEPLLGPDTFKLVETLRPMIDNSIWLGGMNKIANRVDMKGWGAIEEFYHEQTLYASSPLMVGRYYERYKDDPIIKWKDSFKKILGISQPEEMGLDI